jgi:hypothetical protein
MGIPQRRVNSGRDCDMEVHTENVRCNVQFEHLEREVKKIVGAFNVYKKRLRGFGQRTLRSGCI